MKEMQLKAAKRIKEANLKAQKKIKAIAVYHYGSQIKKEIAELHQRSLSENRQRAMSVRQQLEAEKGRIRQVIVHSRLKDVMKCKQTMETNLADVKMLNNSMLKEKQGRIQYIKGKEEMAKLKIRNAAERRKIEVQKIIDKKMQLEAQRKQQLDKELLIIQKIEQVMKTDLDFTIKQQNQAEEHLLLVSQKP